MNKQSSRTALVTGAGQGLGAAIARRLAQDGRKVAVTDVNLGAAEQIAKAIEDDGGSATAHQIDVTDLNQIERGFAATVEQFGSLDILVCNAGVLRDNLLFKMTDEDWDTVIATHLTGAFHCVRAAQTHMVEGHFGRIVLMSSRAAMGNRGQTNYSAAKAALQGMARTIAIELGPFGITANAVAPGHIETAMTRATAERMGIDYEQLRDATVERNAIKRVGQPRDVANVVSFLTADETEYITGQVLYVTGRPLG